jgi:hypothetical protein
MSYLFSADELKLKAAQEVSENLEASWFPNNAHHIKQHPYLSFTFANSVITDDCQLSALS